MDDAKAFMLGLMQTARERFGNPLIGAFAIAWALWNFRIILVLIGSGDGGWKAKIEHIDTKLMPHWCDWAIHSYAVPAAVAVIWIYVLPPVLRKVAAHHERNISRNREAIFSVTETRLLSTEEAMHMRQAMMKQRAEWLAEKYTNSQALENYTKQIENSNQEIKIQNTQISKLKKENEELKDQLSNLKIEKSARFEFRGKTTQEKANALGVQLTQSNKNTESQTDVKFEGYSIKWPWTTSNATKKNLPYPTMLDYPIDQQTFKLMLFLNSNQKIEIEEDFDTWRGRIMIAGYNNADELIRKLILSSYFIEIDNRLKISTDAFDQIKWLENIGFSQGNSTK